MSKTITIAQGDSTIQQAELAGFDANTVWDDPANATLRKKRSDMNALMPGDHLVIPDKRIATVKVMSGASHRFKRRGIPAKFVLQVLEDDKPRANQAYRLAIDDKLFKGTTDAKGVLTEFIPAQAKRGMLYIGPANFKIALEFGQMDPIEELSGVQKRLHNLGFDPGPADGEPKPQTTAAIKQFQLRCGLPDTGQLDETTRHKLDAAHGQIGALPARSGPG